MAIALFIVSVLITFDSIDGAEPLFGRAERCEAHIKFRKAFFRDKLLQKALQSPARYRSQNSAKPRTDFVTIGLLVLAPPSSRFCSMCRSPDVTRKPRATKAFT
jgi:hypothetical protein